MNCHGGNDQGQDNHENGHKGHGKHMLLMVLCCALPIILLMLIPILKNNNPALKSILPFAVVLLCPLMHIMMIPMMFRKDKGGNKHKQDPYARRIEGEK
ncbi:MAG TPA: hypothetical protein DD734_11740 [Firmicutes bacterium]|jgi:glucan phosphoethanolaminetransferase (alkaline phosphatase superfamily)|nr:hypothetical protein [Bacillota bacterium]HBR35298.1 hypothetical protein [Bacillota bacterium]